MSPRRAFCFFHFDRAFQRRNDGIQQKRQVGINNRSRSLGIVLLFFARYRSFVLFIALIGKWMLLPLPCTGAPLVLDPQVRHVTLRSGIEYLIESHPLSYREAAEEKGGTRWLPVTGRNLNLGDAQHPVWFRFEIVAPPEAGAAWLLEVGWPLLDQVQIVQYDPQRRQWHAQLTIGNTVPFAERPIPHRHLLYPLDLRAANPTMLYLRVATRSNFSVALDLWQKEAFMLHDQQQLICLGIFFGILGVMLLYNLSLYIFTRDRSYLLYSVYVFSIILYELAATGLGTQYVWQQAHWFKQYGYGWFASFGFLAAALFVREFLSLKTYRGWVYPCCNVIIVYWIYMVVSIPLWPHKLLQVSGEPMGVLTCVAALVTSIYLWAKGNVSAKYFTIAWTFLNIGTICYILALKGIIPRTPFTIYGQMIGFVLEVVLLSLALAERINRERKARAEAQQVALDLTERVSQEREEKLMVQEQVLEIQRRANEELELRVLDRTNELERAMKNLEMANRELSKLSFTDPLTKLYNRRYFDEVLAGELKRAARTGQPLSVAIADIDLFKRINDTCGHLIGDECLRLVARTLSQQIGRPGDLIARYGGEEYAILLPATSPPNAMIVADRARIAVDRIDFIHRGKRIALSVSIGVAGWIPRQDESPEELIHAADSALYQAKNSGRNKSVVANAF